MKEPIKYEEPKATIAEKEIIKMYVLDEYSMHEIAEIRNKRFAEIRFTLDKFNIKNTNILSRKFYRIHFTKEHIDNL